MIARYNNISLATGIPGIILQIVGYMSQQPGIYLIGSVLLLIGFGYYAVSKGRSPAWALMGFLSCIGLLVLACLKDRTKG